MHRLVCSDSIWTVGLSVNLATLFVLAGAALGDDGLPKHAILRMGSNLFAHGSEIQEIALAPDSSRVVTIGQDRNVRIWSEHGKLLRAIPWFQEPTLYNMSFSTDSLWRLAKTTLNGQRVYLAEHLVTGRQVGVPAGRFPAYLDITSDGALLAACDQMAAASLIDTKSRQTIARVELPVPEAEASGGSRVYLSPDAAFLLAESPPGRWHVFNVRDRKLANQFPPFESRPLAKPVFSAKSGIVAIDQRNARILVRDLSNGENLFELQHGNFTSDTAFTPDGKVLATCGVDGFIRLWSAEKGNLIREINAGEHVTALAFGAEGARLVSGGEGHVRFWNGDTGQEEHLPAPTWLGIIESVAISPDATTAALADSSGEVKLWDLASDKLLETLPERDIPGPRFHPWIGHPFLVFSSTDDFLVAGSCNRHNSVNVWDVAARRRKAHGEQECPVTTVACSRDAKVIVTGGRDKTVRGWTMTGKPVWTSTGNGAQVLTLALAPAGNQVYSAGHTTVIDVWNVTTGALRDQIHIPKDDTQAVRAPAIREGIEPLNQISAISVSASGRYLAAVVGESTSGRRVAVVDTENRKLVFQVGGAGELIHQGDSDTFICAAFHPGLDVLAVGARDGVATLYEAPSGVVLQKLEGHTGAVNSLAWSADGNRLLSGSSDATAILWDTRFLELR